ncbi:succinate dehydrogenase, hydrophobic membrane anchor protein [Spiribacter sp. 2438]|uniref:succinate dehydrogenase, hydrophobic membrane anchor protein n=1 Tax=Spiribacter sp. 2438 TaxID=2666185 RepID=UPI0012B0C0A9|nr:succinate dehydrogenase, hydrophobic membrane anchor protein [Spiribacter sp. 2438]QGM21925.1 succinate dehydrogenase, hydrophobic membrane anchor protein [Spiribacter sp. 2438]
MEFRTPIKEARGLGASHHGASHWWVQRLSAIAMVPLMLWLVVGLAANSGASYAEAAAWLGGPINSVVMVVMFGVLFYHASLGLQVILEDYVSHKGVRLGLVIAVRFLAVVLAVSAIIAVLSIALGG